MKPSTRFVNFLSCFKQHVEGYYKDEKTPRAFDYESVRGEKMKSLEEEK